MEVKVERLEGCKRVLSVELPSERADSVYRDLLNDFRQNLQVPGFRKGKVPENLIKQRFAGELRQEVLGKLVPQALDEAIKSEKLRPVERPTLDEVKYEEGQPLRVSASFEVRPQLQLEKTTDFEISLEAKRYKVEEKQIDEQLEKLRQRSATFKPLEEGRAALSGDFAVVNLRGEPRAEDSTPFRREAVLVSLEEGQPFTRHLVGADTGQRLQFSIEHPEDFDDPAFAGRTVDYTVDLLELKQRMLPDIDDEFARDLGQFPDLKALREEIGRQLEQEAKRERRGDAVDKIVDSILEANPQFDIPAVMLQRQLAAAESETRRSMAGRGVNPDHIGFDWTAFRESQKAPAEREVRRLLLLDEIAEREGITVKPKEVRAEVAAIAASLGEDPKELRRKMLSDGSYESLERRMRDHAVEDWLFEHNRITEG